MGAQQSAAGASISAIESVVTRASFLVGRRRLSAPDRSGIVVADTGAGVAKPAASHELGVRVLERFIGRPPALMIFNIRLRNGSKSVNTRHSVSGGTKLTLSRKKHTTC